MRKYTINEAIEEMKDTVQVFSDGYGTWKVKANIGLRSTGEYAEDYFTTHDEEWKTGEFDGEKYNTYANSDQAREDFDSDAEYEEWRDAVINDSANEDNYESPDERNERAARTIIESWVDYNNTPGNVVVTADNSTIYILDEEERNFAESETANLAMLVDGRGDAFINAFNSREEP
jgi:hypothetical protein